MLQHWLIEIVYAIGRFFLNPLFYWVLLLLVITGLQRIKKERHDFGTKINELFTETKGTLPIALSFGITISLLAIVFGFTLTKDMVYLLAIVIILVSITGSFQFLSAGYTMGVTMILLILLPFLIERFALDLQFFTEISPIHFISLSILLGVFLIIEVFLIHTTSSKYTYPAIVQSKRGIWLGEQQFKRLGFIPFFAFIPAEQLTNIAPLFPFFQVGQNTYHLIFVPFVLGFQYYVQTVDINTLKRRLVKQKFILALIVFLFSLLSLYSFIFVFCSIATAIIGNEWIMYRHQLKERHERSLYTPLDEGLKVLGIIPKSRAEELGIVAGETIKKVNDQPIYNSEDFYVALQAKGAFFKLAILDLNNEIRFVQGALYDEDRLDLGLLFPEQPYVKRQEKRMENIKDLKTI